jgi:hypothetical protein
VVFEADLQKVKDGLNSNLFQKAFDDIEVLRTKIETRYANLTPQQKLQWEPTRAAILHCIDHINETIADRSVPEQKARCQRILNGITVI